MTNLYYDKLLTWFNGVVNDKRLNILFYHYDALGLFLCILSENCCFYTGNIGRWKLTVVRKVYMDSKNHFLTRKLMNLNTNIHIFKITQLVISEPFRLKQFSAFIPLLKSGISNISSVKLKF